MLAILSIGHSATSKSCDIACSFGRKYTILITTSKSQKSQEKLFCSFFSALYAAACLNFAAC